MTVYEHKPYCNAMPDVPHSDSSCVCMKKYSSVPDLVSSVKAMIFPIELDETIWAMLNKYVENQLQTHLLNGGNEISPELKMSMLAHEAKKYTCPSTPMQPMPILMMNPSQNIVLTNLKIPLGGPEPIEGNLTYEPARRKRVPLFKTPPPPDGYQIERELRSGLWVRVTVLSGLRYSSRWGRKRCFRRRLPHFYRRRSSAEKMLSSLLEQNPGLTYRVSPWWIYDGDRAAAKEIETWRHPCGGCDSCIPCQGKLCPCACHKHLRTTSHPDGTVSLHCPKCGQKNGHAGTTVCFQEDKKEWYD